MSETVKVAKAAGVVGSATLLSRVMGYVRDMAMSWGFGTGIAADAFYVAYRIPNLLRELLAEGSMSAAFIPVFTETLATGTREDARRLANAVLAWLIVILLVITGLGILLAPLIVNAIAWGFKGDIEKFQVTVRLTRIMFPYLFFIGLAALVMGMLNSLRAFLLPALSPVLYNLVTIGAVVASVTFLQEPILGVGVGVVLGGLSQFVMQLPGLGKQGMMITPRFTPSHPGVRRVGVLALPILLSSSVTQVNIFIGTILASFLATGSISYLFYGMRFIHFPLGIFGIAIATAVLPTLSTQAARQDTAAFRDTLSLGLRLVFFIMFPALAGLIALRYPIVNLMLEHGRFDWVSTAGTADAVLFYGVGLWAFAGVKIVAQAFYSLQDTRTPVKIAVLALAANVVFSIILMRPLQHGGLALATSLAAMLNIGLLTKKLRKKIGRLDGKRILRSLLKIVPASAVMGMIGWWVSRDPAWRSPGNEDMLYKIELLLGSIAGSALFYFIVMWLLRSEELSFLIDLFRKKRTPFVEQGPGAGGDV